MAVVFTGAGVARAFGKAASAAYKLALLYLLLRFVVVFTSLSDFAVQATKAFYALASAHSGIQT